MSLSLLKQVCQAKGSTSQVEGRYANLSTDRNTYLDRAREYSKFTLPYVLTDSEDQSRGGASNQHGYQGIGAQAVNHLANKLTTTMFPVGKSFFNPKFTKDMEAQLTAGGYDVTALQELMVEAEERCDTLQDKIAARVAYVDIMKNLLIAGNVCPFLPVKGNLQSIKLDRYVLTRDLSGELIELITLQKKAFNTLSAETQQDIKNAKRVQGAQAPGEDENINIYTWVYRKDEKDFCVSQIACGIVIKDFQTISALNLPWKPQRWNSTYGEDYGRGHVEDHAGDFYVVEFLSEAIAKGMALMADVKYLIKPGSVTDIDEISQAPVGEWIFGNLDDIGVLQLEKYADFEPISNVLKEYERRIGQAFLLNSAMRRDAERVTTVELRLDAIELEGSLGGIYSLLNQTLSVPLARMYLNRISFPLPQEVVDIHIVAGLSSLGKAGDLDKIKQYTEMMQLPATWPVQLQERTKFDIFSREVAASLSMKLPWTMTDEEWQAKIAAQKQQQQDQNMADGAINAAPEIVKQIGGQQNAGG